MPSYYGTMKLSMGCGYSLPSSYGRSVDEEVKADPSCHCLSLCIIFCYGGDQHNTCYHVAGSLLCAHTWDVNHKASFAMLHPFQCMGSFHPWLLATQTHLLQQFRQGLCLSGLISAGQQRISHHQLFDCWPLVLS